MKKVFMSLAVVGLMAISASYAIAQDPATATEQTATPNEDSVAQTPAVTPDTAEQTTDADTAQPAGEPIHQQIKIKFIEGGAGFMATVLICLIFGLAIVIERIIYLNMATTNTDKLLRQIEAALSEGGVEAAKEVCRNTRGPVASIFYQGISRMDEGMDVVEKSVVSYGGVQMSQMESGLSWVQLFIAVAPMLGFLGTVIGMIEAFDAIQRAGDISPNIVAAGMKVALITTVGGLVVAIILQIFYNYLVSKIDSLVLAMEDSSIALVDLLVKYSKR